MRLLHPLFFISLGLFGLCTIEFGVVGVMPEIMRRFSVSAQQSGMLTSVFALVVALCGPVLVLFLSRYNRKILLLISLAVFTISSLASAFVTDFNMLLAVRMVPALFHPVYFSLAFVSALSLYPKAQSARASALVFMGTTIGIVLGVPITAYLGNTISYEASFYFTAAVNALSFFGVLFLLPQMPAGGAGSSRKQLHILRKPALWLNIGSTGLVFAGAFAVYSYAAQYLRAEVGMPADTISLLLVLFGLGGVAGNLLAGKLIARSMVVTVLANPVLIAVSLLLVMRFQHHVGPMIAIVLFWGAAHTSTLVISQIWLTSEAPEAPEFANAIFASIANLGVAVGASVSGSFISQWGLPGIFSAGGMFLAAALALMLVRVWRMRSRTIRRGFVSASGGAVLPSGPIRLAGPHVVPAPLDGIERR